jgi:hypothetical protein
VETARANPVPTWVAVTLAEGTTLPEGSVTVPRRLAAPPWAKASSVIPKNINRPKRIVCLNLSIIISSTDFQPLPAKGISNWVKTTIFGIILSRSWHAGNHSLGRNLEWPTRLGDKAA